LSHASAGNKTDVASVCRLVPSLLNKPQLSIVSLDHSPSDCVGHDAWKGAGLPAPPREVVCEGWKTALCFIRVRRVGAPLQTVHHHAPKAKSAAFSSRSAQFHDSTSHVLAAASAFVVFSRCSLPACVVQRHALLGTMLSQRSTGPVSLQRKLYLGYKRLQLLCCGCPLSALLLRLATVVDHSGRTSIQHMHVVCIMKRFLSSVARRLWSKQRV